MRLRAGVEALFPRAEPAPPRSSRALVAGRLPAAAVAVAVSVAVSGAGAVGLTLLGLRRIAGDAAPRTVWAEDGSRFLAEWHLDGFWATLLRAHAGYGQVGQRALVPVVDLLPIQLTAAYLATLSAGCVALIGLLVYRAAAAHLPERLPRLLLAGLGTVLPYAAYEASDNVANLQWFVVWGAFWALLWRPTGRAGLVVCTCYLALAVPDAPTAVVLLPIALARLVVLPRWRDRLPALAFLAGCLLQGLIVVGASRANASHPPGLPAQLRTYLVRIVLGSLDGLRGTTAHWVRFGWLAVAGAAVLLAGCLVAGLLERRARPLTALAAAFSLVYFAVGERFALGTVPAPTSSDAHLGPSSRYFVVPMLLTLTVAICGAVAAARRWPRVGPVLAVLLAIPFGWSVQRDLASVTTRTTAITWAQGLERARVLCAQPGASRLVWVPVAGGPGFRTPVACSRL